MKSKPRSASILWSIGAVVPNYALKGTLRTSREFPDSVSAQGPLTRR